MALPDDPLYLVVEIGVAWALWRLIISPHFLFWLPAPRMVLEVRFCWVSFRQGSLSSSQEPGIGPAVGGPE